MQNSTKPITAVETSENEKSKLESVFDRLSAIEDIVDVEQSEKFRKFGAWAGLIALLISMIVGGLEIYDRTAGAKNRALQETQLRDEQVISKATEKLFRLSQELLVLQASNKWQEAMVRTPAINAEKYKILSDIERFDSKTLSELDSIVLTQFSFEFLNLGRSESAINFAEMALKQADTFEMKVESRRYIAQALFFPSSTQDLPRARKLMREAVELTNGIVTPVASSLKLGVYQNWISGEIYNGQCNHAKTVIEESIVALSPIMLNNPLYTESGVKQHYSSLSPTCDFN